MSEPVVKFETSGEEGLMVKIMWTPKGADVAIATPHNEVETSQLIQAIGALVVFASRQLEMRKAVCHGGCAMDMIITEAREEAEKRFPELFKQYFDAVRKRIVEKVESKMTADPMPGDVNITDLIPPKREQH